MRRLGKLQKVWPWLLLALSLCLSLFLEFRLGNHNLDADRASEFVLAQVLNREHALLSRNWYYSTELRIVSPVPLYQLALILFPSWKWARLFSIAVLMMGTVACFLYLCKGMDRLQAGIYMAAVLVLPFSSAYLFLFAWGGFYTVDLMLCCLLLGMNLRLGKRSRVPLWIWTGILSLWGGLAGVRLPMLLGVPLVLAAFFEVLRENVPENRRRLLAAVLGLGFEGIGYGIHRLVLCRIYDFRSYEQMRLGQFSLNRLLGQLDAVLTFLGYRQGMPLLSLSGMVSFVLIALFFAIPVLGVLLYIDTVSRDVRFVCLCAGMGTGMVLVLLSCLEGFDPLPETCGYCLFALWLLMFVPYLFIFERWHGIIRTAGMTLLTGVFLLGTLCMARQELRASLSPAEKAVQILRSEGLTKGCATFWNGNLLTELSDGEIEVTTFSTWSSGVPQPWLQEKQHMGMDGEGPVFVLITDYEEMTFRCPCAQPDHFVADADTYHIYRYDSMQEVARIQQGL